jgi:hypothetical protein
MFPTTAHTIAKEKILLNRIVPWEPEKKRFDLQKTIQM